jgi:capsular polysaccharide transport system ATP-binding protein
MTIRIENLRKSVMVKGVAHAVFDGLNLSIERGARVGILGLPRSGKTTLLNVISGSERLYTGSVFRDMTSSWVIPFGDFFMPRSTIAWGLRFVARLYGVGDPEFANNVASLVQASQYLNMIQAECPGPVRQQLAFAVPMAMDFDLYLFDNALVPGSKNFKEIGKALLEERTAGRAIAIATSNEAEVSSCELAYVLENGRATYFADVKEGVSYFKELKKAEQEAQMQAEQKQELEDAEPAAISDDSLNLLGVAVSDL